MRNLWMIVISSLLSSIAAIILKRTMNHGAEWKSATYSFLLGAVLPIILFWGHIMYRGVTLTLNLEAVIGGMIWAVALLIYNYYFSTHGFIYTGFMTRAFVSCFTIILGVAVLSEYPSLKQASGLALIVAGIFLL